MSLAVCRCGVQVRCAACRCGVQLIVVRDFLCLWHSSEDNLGDKTSRTSPGGGTTLQEKCLKGENKNVVGW